MRWIKPPLTALDRNMAVWGATFSASCRRKRWGRSFSRLSVAFSSFMAFFPACFIFIQSVGVMRFIYTSNGYPKKIIYYVNIHFCILLLTSFLCLRVLVTELLPIKQSSGCDFTQPVLSMPKGRPKPADRYFQHE